MQVVVPSPPASWSFARLCGAVSRYCRPQQTPTSVEPEVPSWRFPAFRPHPDIARDPRVAYASFGDVDEDVCPGRELYGKAFWEIFDSSLLPVTWKYPVGYEGSIKEYAHACDIKKLSGTDVGQYAEFCLPERWERVLLPTPECFMICDARTGVALLLVHLSAPNKRALPFVEILPRIEVFASLERHGAGQRISVSVYDHQCAQIVYRVQHTQWGEETFAAYALRAQRDALTFLEGKYVALDTTLKFDLQMQQQARNRKGYFPDWRKPWMWEKLPEPDEAS